MKQKHSPIWTFLALLVLAIFLIFVVYPLVLIMYKSVVNPADNSFTLANFTRFFTRKYYTNTLLNSFKVTVVSTLISATLGLVIAYITRQYRIAGSKALNICIVVSYLSPPFIGAYAWIQLLGRNGLFTKWINAIFGTSFGGIYGFAGIVLVFSLPERGGRKPGCQQLPARYGHHSAAGAAYGAGILPAGVHARVLRFRHAHADRRGLPYLPGGAI